MDSFNSDTVARLTGVSLRQLAYWDKTDFIKPSVRAAGGRGTVRLYSFLDMLQIRVALRLREQGVSIQKMRKALDFLRHHTTEERPLAHFRLLTDGETLFVLTDDPQKMVDVLMRPGQVVFSLPIGEEEQALRAKVLDLAQEEEAEVVVAGRSWRVTLRRDLQDGGWVGSCPELPGCHSQGESRVELLLMLEDAVDTWLAGEQGASPAPARGVK